MTFKEVEKQSAELRIVNYEFPNNTNFVVSFLLIFWFRTLVVNDLRL